MDFITDRDKAVIVAVLAQEAERHYDVVEAMKYVATTVNGLTKKERTLFVEGYKVLISTRRNSLLALSKRVGELAVDDPDDVLTINKYIRWVEVDAIEICNEVLSILDQRLIPSADSTPEAFVVYATLKGDVHRYLTEFKTDPDDKQEAAHEAFISYEAATILATAQFSPAHHILLNLHLNHSVLQHDVLENPSRAKEILYDALENALPALGDLNRREDLEQSNELLRRINGNLNKWGTPDPAIFGDGDFNFTVPSPPPPPPPPPPPASPPSPPPPASPSPPPPPPPPPNPEV